MPKHYVVGAATARHAPGALYDAYGAALYGYCWSLLGDEGAAAVALVRVMCAAAGDRPDLLRQRPQWRPEWREWRLSTALFRLARDACRLASPRPRRDRPGRSRFTPLPALVTNALCELTAGERDVLELCVRHRFHGRQLAAVLDITPATAEAWESAARLRFNQAFGTVVLASSGMLAVPHGLADDPPPPSVLLGMLAPPPPPAGLRSAVITACERLCRAPESGRTRVAVPGPRPPDPAERNPTRRRGPLPAGVGPITSADPPLSVERVAWARDHHPVAPPDTADLDVVPDPRARHGAIRTAARWTARLAAAGCLATGEILLPGGPLW